jgi:hypothetical protein
MLLAGKRLVPAWYDLLFWGFVSFCNLNPPAATAPQDDVDHDRH